MSPRCHAASSRGECGTAREADAPRAVPVYLSASLRHLVLPRPDGVRRPTRLTRVRRPTRLTGVRRPTRLTGVRRRTRLTGVRRPTRLTGVRRRTRLTGLLG